MNEKEAKINPKDYEFLEKALTKHLKEAEEEFEDHMDCLMYRIRMFVELYDKKKGLKKELHTLKRKAGTCDCEDCKEDEE